MTREEARLYIIRHCNPDYPRGKTEWERAVNMAIKALEQPERKKGKWNFIGDQMFECTECGVCYTQSQFRQMRVRIIDPEFPKFCTNCGADMKEGEAEC